MQPERVTGMEKVVAYCSRIVNHWNDLAEGPFENCPDMLDWAEARGDTIWWSIFSSLLFSCTNRCMTSLWAKHSILNIRKYSAFVSKHRIKWVPHIQPILSWCALNTSTGISMVAYAQKVQQCTERHRSNYKSLLRRILFQNDAEGSWQLAKDLAAGDCFAAFVLLYDLRPLVDYLHPPPRSIHMQRLRQLP